MDSLWTLPLQISSAWNQDPHKLNLKLNAELSVSTPSICPMLDIRFRDRRQSGMYQLQCMKAAPADGPEESTVEDGAEFGLGFGFGFGEGNSGTEIYTGAMGGSNFICEPGPRPRIRTRLGESEGKLTIRVQAHAIPPSPMTSCFYPLYAVYAPTAPPSFSPARPRDQGERSERYAYGQTPEPVSSVHASGASAAA
ncbi:hypothetical protein FIBSPDRAFT_946578 [Athelia psychrophila]|uniref:Uncharacterized protein n=1 Tax=Athelia psychrophila TaxID=1759441 RepID=A0A166SPJ5_9AGAM|nr:hypothetical protein FIBSPDRAFT_946578 [Fibularhizoctonia sp. CBS 109695]